MADPANAFLDDLENLLLECERKNSEQRFTENDFEICRRRLEHFIQTLELLCAENDGDTVEINGLLTGTRPWLTWLESLPLRPSSCCTRVAAVRPARLVTNQPGQPPFIISKDCLEYLRDSNFTWVQIAKMFGVSRATISRRVQEYGIQRRETMTDISDAELSEIISEIHRSHFHAGCRIVHGILRSRNIYVPARRVHETLTAVDPVLSFHRWGAMVRRRQYSVKGANSLWHIDGHHSLIRWGLVVHGGKTNNIAQRAQLARQLI